MQIIIHAFETSFPLDGKGLLPVAFVPKLFLINLNNIYKNSPAV